jgi:hypothetical protein
MVKIYTSLEMPNSYSTLLNNDLVQFLGSYMFVLQIIIVTQFLDIPTKSLFAIMYSYVPYVLDDKV